MTHVSEQAFNQKFALERGEKYFSVDSHQDSDVVYVTVTLQNQDQSFFYPVEGRILLRENALRVQEAIDLLVDYIDLYFEEYFRDSDTYLPIDWSDFTYNEKSFQLKGQVLNRLLEKLADDWLEGRVH